MFVNERFVLAKATVEKLKLMKPEFGYNGFGEMIFYRTYSRTKPDGSKESWFDVVRRVTEGVFSIRKDWYVKNHIEWDEELWQEYAIGFAESMFKMNWLPPGRGLWAMGTDYVYSRGSMALYNCAATTISDDIGSDIHWLMDCLMNGVGVGFEPLRSDAYTFSTYTPSEENGVITNVIPDSREGWCDSVKLHINSYLSYGHPVVKHDYRLIREAGLPIRGFGGVSSGPAPLKYLHQQIDKFFKMFHELEWYDSLLLKTDLANAVGCCVVAGNVRRSAELCKGSIQDQVFMNMKDYSIYPHRAELGWMSNNSVALNEDCDFDRLGEVARRVIKNGEPGYINVRNLRRGRIGKSDDVRRDEATLFNPCGEIPLEPKETCNIAETFPTRCDDIQEWYQACKYAAFYTSTVSLLPTHRKETNAVVAKNRRIGVGIVDYTGWVKLKGQTKVIRALREGYKVVRRVNKEVNAEAGVPEAIRVTTIKPGGTVPKLAGKTPGIGYPTFKYTERRVRVNNNSNICKVLKDAGVPHEPDVTQPDVTTIFSFPMEQGPSKPIEEVSLWEQAMNLITVQREWADNAVSNTLYFRPKWRLIQILPYPNAYEFHEDEEDDETKIEVVEEYGEKKVKIYEHDHRHEEGIIEQVLSAIAPLTKSVSLLPHSPIGVYPQMPESFLSQEDYENFPKPDINWCELRDEDAEIDDEKYCSGGVCVRPS